MGEPGAEEDPVGRRGGASVAASLRLRGATSGLWRRSRPQQPAVASLAALCSRSIASKTPVGFIRVGNVGNPMAKDLMRGFPGGAVVENLPANAGDVGSSPGLGRSHMPRSN